MSYNFREKSSYEEKNSVWVLLYFRSNGWVSICRYYGIGLLISVRRIWSFQFQFILWKYNALVILTDDFHICTTDVTPFWVSIFCFCGKLYHNLLTYILKTLASCISHSANFCHVSERCESNFQIIKANFSVYEIENCLYNMKYLHFRKI